MILGAVVVPPRFEGAVAGGDDGVVRGEAGPQLLGDRGAGDADAAAQLAHVGATEAVSEHVHRA